MANQAMVDYVQHELGSEESLSLVRSTKHFQDSEPRSKSCSGLTLCPDSCPTGGKACETHDFYVTKPSALSLKKPQVVGKITPKASCGTSGCNCAWVNMYVAACQSNALGCLRRLRGEQDGNTTTPITNEQELRYAAGDPIMNMICDLGPCKVHLEETVAAQLKQEKAGQAQASSPAPSKSRSQPATPNTETREAVSTESRADYTCYTIRSNNTGEVTSVVIEAKTGKRATYAVAQAIGYFIAFETQEILPPVVFVLTASVIKILVFPFRHRKGGDLCIALKVKDLPLWEIDCLGGTRLAEKTLTFLALLTLHRPRCDVTLKCRADEIEGEFKKFLRTKVLTDEAYEIQQLKEKYERELEKERKEHASLRRENEEELERKLEKEYERKLEKERKEYEEELASLKQQVVYLQAAS